MRVMAASAFDGLDSPPQVSLPCRSPAFEPLETAIDAGLAGEHLLPDLGALERAPLEMLLEPRLDAHHVSGKHLNRALQRLELHLSLALRFFDRVVDRADLGNERRYPLTEVAVD